MQFGSKRDHALLVLGCFGIVAAVLSGLEAHVPWLASLCSGFSSGCRETARFTLIQLPLWVWGLGFYLVFLAFFFWLRAWIHALVALGVGIEFSLSGIMVSQGILCVFCLVNLAVMFLILLLVLRRPVFWQCCAISLLSLLVFNAWLSRENRELLQGVAEKPAVAAEVRGRTITFQEVEFPLAHKLLELQKEAYALKKERLENLITEMLLEQEADRQGMSIQDLVRKEVLARGGLDVSEDEVKQYISENRSKWADWHGSEEQLQHQVRIHLRNQKAYEAANAYAWSLVKEDEVRIFLEEPRLPLVRVSTEHNYSLGPEDAPVTVVEFSDYECPVCRKTHENVVLIRERYEGKIRWVFKDYPLRQHRWAAKAAEAARCAGDQGKFWEYQDAIYASGKELNPEQLKFQAGQTGLDVERFQECLTSGRHAKAVERDREEGRASGITSTPTYIINGKYYPGAPSLERFIEMIEAELGQKGRPPEKR